MKSITFTAPSEYPARERKFRFLWICRWFGAPVLRVTRNWSAVRKITSIQHRTEICSDLVRPEAGSVIEDLRCDHQFICAGLFDECLQ